MSLFNKLFGGKKKEETPAPPPVPEKVSKEIEGEKIMFEINQKINKLEDQTNKLEYDADIATAKAKEYMAAGKKKEARAQVAELAEIKKKIESLNVKKKVLRTQKTSVSTAMTDLDIADTMEAANKFFEGQDNLNDKINDLVFETKDIQSRMQETDRLMRELAESNEEDEQETDAMFKQLEDQVETEKAADMKKKINIGGQPAVVQPIAQSQVVEDQFSKWMN